MTAWAQDVDVITSKQKIDVASQLTSAARESGRSPFAIALDFLKLRKRRGKLKFYEYFLYSLYDTKLFSEEDRDRFISAHMHWPVSNACNNREWWAVTENKWLSSVFLKQNGVPIPENCAIFDCGPQFYPDLPRLKTAEDLKAFFASFESYPLFAKPIGGMWSAGAMRISHHTETHVLVDGGEPVTYEHLADTVFADKSYIFQSCLKPHSFFDGITDATATIRSVNIILRDGQLKVPYTLLKLPMQGNIADNFWRSGNVLCDLDPETGEVRNIVTAQNGRRTPLESLPGNARAFIGERLPCWQELKALNERVALLHAANRYGSTDIALTEDGPVVVEVNTGCAFELMQIARGQGLLTDEMTSFFGSVAPKSRRGCRQLWNLSRR